MEQTSSLGLLTESFSEGLWLRTAHVVQYSVTPDKVVQDPHHSSNNLV